MIYSDLGTCVYFRKTRDVNGKNWTDKWLPREGILRGNQVITHAGDPVESISWTKGMGTFCINVKGGSRLFMKEDTFTLHVSDVIYTPVYEV